MSIVRLAGPPAGGALFGVGAAVPFVADLVSYAFSTVSLLAMRTPFQQRRERADTHVLAEAADGVRFVWANPFLRLTTLMLLLGNFSASGVQLAIVVLTKQHHIASAGVGALVALIGATTLLGATASPLVRRFLSPRAILLSEFWASLALVSFLARPSVYVLAAPFAFMVLVLPLGPLAAGLLIEKVSPRAAIALFLGVVLVAAVSGTLSRSTREVPAIPEASPEAAG
jgi:hypothetical protein